MAQRFFALLVLTVVLGACAVRPPPAVVPEKPVAPKVTLEQATFAMLPGWANDQVADALPAFLRSCDRIERLPANRSMDVDGGSGTASDWRPACAAARTVPKGDERQARAFFEGHFIPWRVSDNGKTDGLFTGYYEPQIKGSLTRHGPYRVPLHRRPPELVMVDLGAFRDDLRGERIAGRVENGYLRPYADRAAIAEGALANRKLELAFVEDPVEAFFLQVQGSGRIVLENGQVVRVGFDGHNGYPYASIGKELIKRGVLSRHEASAQRIAQWVAENPTEGRKVLNVNRSYIFFRVLEGDGPIGAQGVALTPERSMAVDRV
ncbi:MAG: MltA domain-containing protein, partial [Rhodospirillales bacterium]|nr:MltA domain-containing protein [Rhodospirillales bacterium]